MLLITRASPEVPNLLGLDVAAGERRAVQGRRGDLEDGQRRSQLVQGLGDTRDAGDQGRQRDGEALPEGGQGQQVSQSRLHRGEAPGSAGWKVMV